LLRTTREVLERGAREGRERVEEALAARRRDSALAELGEIVLELIRRGEIDAAELPEVRDVLTRLDDLDAGDTHATAEHAPPPPSSGRARFDRRAAPATEDGTVAAATWTPIRKAIPGDPRSPAPDGAGRVWRPPAAPSPPVSVRDPGNPERKGGIRFDDDDDLADYMHPDDVPAKHDSGGSGDSGSGGSGSNA
jgi:hypothetical protein